jgi:Putative adhesin
MSNQEMQFADPDWKPSQQLNNKTNPQEQEEYIPQPINADYREQNQWRAAPPSPPQQEGYSGLRPYAGPSPQQMQGGNFRQRPYRRRGRGPWFWIILALIIIAMTSGGFRSFHGPGPDYSPFNPKQMMVNPITYTVTGQPTIVINDPNGNVTVIPGQSNNDVTIQPVNENNFSGNPNNNQPVSSQDGNTIKASVPDSQQGTVDLQVTVPQGANLQLQTDSGNINVTGVDGQMTLTTNDGSINASNDGLNGLSTMTTTNSGDINFDGTLGTGGSYQFITSSGNVNLTVASTQTFHVDATTNSGSITSEFSSVHVQNNDPSSSAKASGDVGNSSSGQGAKVTITAQNGNINLNQK